jgi:guanylate kinase
MVIVDLKVQTHSRLKKVKKEMKHANKPIYKINNDIVINHALKKVEEVKHYEISNTD